MEAARRLKTYFAAAWQAAPWILVAGIGLSASAGLNWPGVRDPSALGRRGRRRRARPPRHVSFVSSLLLALIQVLVQGIRATPSLSEIVQYPDVILNTASQAPRFLPYCGFGANPRPRAPLNSNRPIAALGTPWLIAGALERKVDRPAPCREQCTTAQPHHQPRPMSTPASRTGVPALETTVAALFRLAPRRVYKDQASCA